MSRVTTKEYREIKDFLKNNEDYVGAMKKFQRSFTTVRRVFLSDNWWEYRSHKSVKQLMHEDDHKPARVSYEPTPNKGLDRKYKALFAFGIVKDILVIGLILLGLVSIIGGKLW